MKQKNFRILLIFFTLAGIGGILIPQLQVHLLPSKQAHQFVVDCSYPFADEQVVEKNVTAPIEAILSRIKGLQHISSVSSKGRAHISLRFDNTENTDYLRLEISAAIRQIYNQLPNGVSYPIISQQKSQDDEKPHFIEYTVINTQDDISANQWINQNIIMPLARINGVGRIDYKNSSEWHYAISLDYQRLKNYGIRLADVEAAIQLFFTKKPLGYIQNQSTNGNIALFQVVFQSRPKTDWHDLTIKTLTDKRIPLNEIAEIQLQKHSPTSLLRINGFPASLIAIHLEKQANSIVVAKQIETFFHNLKTKLPEKLLVVKTHDTATEMNNELHTLYKRSLLTLLILLSFVFLVHREWAYMLTVFFSIAANILIAVIVYWLLNVPVHLYSLAGLTVSFGLIIDSCLIMAEELRTKKRPNIILEIVATTLTSVAALLFVFFLDNETQLLVRDFSTIIIINMVLSVVVALYFTPAIFRQLRAQDRQPKISIANRRRIVKVQRLYINFIRVLHRHKKKAFIIIILLFGIPVFLLPVSLPESHPLSKTYNSTIGHKIYQRYIKKNVEVVLGGTLRLFYQYVASNYFYSFQKDDALQFHLQMPANVSRDETLSVVGHVEAQLSQLAGVKYYSSYISGNNTVRITVRFTTEAIRNGTPVIAFKKIVSTIANYGNTKWTLTYKDIFASDNDIKGEYINFKIALYGYNFTQLQFHARQLREKLKQHPRVLRVTFGRRDFKPEYIQTVYRLNVSDTLLARHTTDLQAVSNALDYYSGSQGRLLMINDLKPSPQVHLTIENAPVVDAYFLQNQALALNQSYTTLNQLGDVEKTHRSTDITKEDQQYIVVLDFLYSGTEYKGREYLKSVIQDFQKQLPVGFSSEEISMYGEFQEIQTDWLWIVVLLIIATIYIICSILLESLRQPLLIISIVPFSFIGVFLFGYLFELHFSLGIFVSFIVISGLTVNSTIHIINEMNNLRKQKPHYNRESIYFKAFKNKIFPVSLTIISTIIGLIPFLTGQVAVFWKHLAISCIGGLVFSLIGMVIYLPLCFFFAQNPQIK